MFDFLFEGRLAVYALLAAVGAVLVALWWRDRRKAWLVGLAGVAVVILAYLALDRAVETGHEQVGRKLKEMAAAVKDKDAETINRHVSERFDYAGIDKAAFRRAVEAEFRSGRVQELVLWEEKYPDEKGLFVCRVKPKGASLPQELDFRVRCEFVKDGDGQWRLKTFTVHNQVNNQEFPLAGYLQP